MLKEFSSPQCLNFLKKIIFSVHTNLDFIHLTHIKASYYPLFMTSILSFDQSPALEVRLNFLDISNIFDNVWLLILFKLEHIGLSGNLLSLLKSFLNNRFQRVALNGQCSNWSFKLAGVPQGSILETLIFLIYHISSIKCHVSNKRHPLISSTPLGIHTEISTSLW